MLVLWLRLWPSLPVPFQGAAQDSDPVVGLAGKGAGLGMEGAQARGLWGRLVGGGCGAVPKAVPLMLFQPR